MRAMQTKVERNWTPFYVVGAILAITFLAVARLPESFVAQMKRNRPFFDSAAEADWAYRILATVAIAQAIYGGFVLLQVDRIRRARDNDPDLSVSPRSRVLGVTMRTAAAMVLLTLLYGGAALWFTGLRGGFWLFAVVCLIQLAWYIRQVNVVASYLDFQREPAPQRPTSLWTGGPDDYCPPIARGLAAPPGPAQR